MYMIPIKTRLIREHNRIYKFWMRLLWRLYGMDSPIVLMVHGFKEKPHNAFELTRASFEKLMLFLNNNGWHAMTQEELIAGNWRKKSFYLTFDDVYDTVFTEAFPVLQKLNIPFTLFVTRDLVDKETYITQTHLGELKKSPLCSIGAHGIQHLVFRNLSREEVAGQCTVSSTFAFPYGRIVEVSCSNRRQIGEMDYALGFSALEGTLSANWFSGRYFLPRVNVSERFVEKFVAGEFPKFKDCEGR